MWTTDIEGFGEAGDLSVTPLGKYYPLEKKPSTFGLSIQISAAFIFSGETS